MHVLRYAAFGLCWFAKLSDGWSSVMAEALVISLFALPALVLVIRSTKALRKKRLNPIMQESARVNSDLAKTIRGFFDRSIPFDQTMKMRALASVGLGVVLLVLENGSDSTMRVYAALAQVAFGVSTFFLWSTLDCADKDDLLASFR